LAGLVQLTLAAIFLAFASCAAHSQAVTLKTESVSPDAISTDLRRPRVSLELDGAPNFRDIGGYPTTDGRHVRAARIYRSNALNNLTPLDQRRVADLHLATVIDLRTVDERHQAPDVWIVKPAEVVESTKQTLAPMLEKILVGNPDSATVQLRMSGFYEELPDLYRSEYAAFFRSMATGELPLLVHCTAGKDRTGVAIALLLQSLGVPRQYVVDDYRLTDRLLPPDTLSKQIAGQGAQSPLARLPEDARLMVLRADEHYLLAALDSIDTRYGSISSYLSVGLGLPAADAQRLRERLLE
jgi:protein-tyrosine phosphatase